MSFSDNCATGRSSGRYKRDKEPGDIKTCEQVNQTFHAEIVERINCKDVTECSNIDRTDDCISR